MESVIETKNGAPAVLQSKELVNETTRKNNLVDSFAELEQGVYAALETYSNVHRGSGIKSRVTTHLYEQARDIILEHLGLNRKKYVVVFCTPGRARELVKQLSPGSYQILSGSDIGLSLGVRAIAINRKSLPKDIHFQTGGGTTRLVSKNWVDWANAPEKFEAGTPAIINIIAFARALRLTRNSGKDIFPERVAELTTVNELLYHDDLDKFTGKELLAELKKTIIGSNITVPTSEGESRFINLDHSASTPAFEAVWNTWRKSLHQSTRVQQEIIREVKSICATLVGASLAEYEVIFTSNTTEAINLAAGNLNCEPGQETGQVVINTMLEHSSNDLPWRILPKCSLVRLSVDADGFIDVNELETLLDKYNHPESQEKSRVRIIAVSGASNVLGVCNNILEISRIAHRYGARVLVDAAQLIAHRTIDMQACEADYLAFSAHKLYAPFGCGVLVVRKGLLKFNPSESESIIASGEENVAGIAALGKVCVLLQRIGMDHIREEEQKLTAKALHAMSQVHGLKIYGIQSRAHPRFDQKLGVIVFDVKGMMSTRLAHKLDVQHGIGVRYGCHCAHIIIKHLLNISPGLERFQRVMLSFFPKINLPGLTRVSLGIGTSDADIETLIRALNNIHKKTGGSSATRDVAKHMHHFTGEASRKVFQ